MNQLLYHWIFIFSFSFENTAKSRFIDNDRRCLRYAWPLAGVGWTLAAYHCLVFYGWVAEGLVPCGKGGSCADAELQVAGLVPIPLLSLLAFSGVVLLLVLAGKREKEHE